MQNYIITFCYLHRKARDAWWVIELIYTLILRNHRLVYFGIFLLSTGNAGNPHVKWWLLIHTCYSHSYMLHTYTPTAHVAKCTFTHMHETHPHITYMIHTCSSQWMLCTHNPYTLAYTCDPQCATYMHNTCRMYVTSTHHSKSTYTCYKPIHAMQCSSHIPHTFTCVLCMDMLSHVCCTHIQTCMFKACIYTCMLTPVCCIHLHINVM